MEAPELPIERRRVRPWMICLALAMGLVVLLVSGFGLSLLISERRVREELAKIRAAGEPVTVADLQTLYSLPPGSQDTTSLWLEALAVVRQPEYKTAAAGLPIVGDKTQVPPADKPWPEQPTVEEFLTAYGPLLSTLREAAAVGGAARFPSRFAIMGSDVEASLMGRRALGRLLTLDCEFRLRSGDIHAAARSVDAIFALANSLNGHPVSVVLLLRLAEEGLAWNCLQKVLATHDLSDEELAKFDADLAGIDYYAHLHRAMLGARVMSMELFDNPAPLTGAGAGAGTMFFRQADRAVYLQLMREVVTASAATDQASLRARMDDARRSIRLTFESRVASWKYPIAKLSLDSVTAFVDAVGHGTARCRVARTAVAVERFRIANGRLPETLEELVPRFLSSVSGDPYDGAPLRWTADGDDYRVYSVGPDRVDQGGEVDESGAGRDFVFRVPLHKGRRGSHAEQP